MLIIVGRGLPTSVKLYTRQAVQAARYAGKRAVQIVAVTDSDVSPACEQNRRWSSVPETPSFFHTMVPALAAIKCLTERIAARRAKP